MKLELTSIAFANNSDMPARFTCDGDNVSPPLSWSGVPQIAKSLALIMDDPDAPDPAAPKRTWVHWVIYNIAANSPGLAENASVQLSETPAQASTQQGVNDWNKVGYGGPCPPIGRHRYFHKLYALDTMLELKQPTKAQLLAAMKGHVLAEAVLVGTYQKQSGSA